MPEIFLRPRIWILATATAAVLLVVALAGPMHSRAPRPASRANASHADASQADARAATGNPRAAYGHLPLAFEPNAGRFGADVHYVARAAGHTLLVRRDGMSIVTGRAALSARLAGAHPARLAPAARLPGRLNLLIGKDHSKWKRGLPMFGAVRALGAYPGIDVVYHGSQRKLEYDFELAPGADPSQPALALEGAKRIRLTRGGDLVATLSDGSTVREQRPLAYQPGGRRVAASFVVRGSTVGFRVGDYDRSKKLVIDPVFGYSTFLGGSGADAMVAVAAGADGSAYVAGNTTSTSFPGVTATTKGAAGPNNQWASCTPNCSDVVVTKLTPDGSAASWVTIFGGTHEDWAGSIALGQSVPGVYVGGTTESSSDFPISNGLGSFLISAGFLAKLKPDGSDFDWVTVVSRPYNPSPLSNYGYVTMAPDQTTPGLAGGGIAVQEHLVGTTPAGYDDVYLVGGAHSYGSCTTFCTSPCTGPCHQLNVLGQDAISTNAHRTTPYTSTGDDAWVIRIAVTNASATAEFGTFLGGTGLDLATAVATMPGFNDVWVTGYTESSDFSKKDPGHGFLDQTAEGSGDAWVAQIKPLDATDGLYGAGYMGGTAQDYPTGIATQVVPAGSCCKSYMVGVVGSTYSTSWTATQNSGDSTAPFTSTHNAGGDGRDGFYVEMDGNSSNDFLDEVAFVGGSGSDYATGIARNPEGWGWQITGNTKSTDFPTSNDTIDGAATTGGGSSKSNVFVAEPGVYSSLLDLAAAVDQSNGIAVDSSGRAYVVGSASTNFITTPGAYQTTAQSGTNGFVSRVDHRAPLITSGPSALTTSTAASFDYNSGAVLALYQFECRLDNDAFADCGAGGTSGASSSKSYPGPLADGLHSFRVRQLDPLFQPSVEARRDFTIDTHPPTGVAPTSPAAGATVTDPKPTLKWSAGADATSSIAGYTVSLDGKKLADTDSSACNGGECALSVSTALANGAHSWNVLATDAAGNKSAAASTTFSVAQPPVAAFTIAPNPVGVGRNVTFDASTTSSVSPIAHYEWDLDGNGSLETDAGSAPAITNAYGAAGTITITLRVTDSTGLTSTTSQVLRVTDIAAPDTKQFGVTINNAAQYTNDPHVKLSLRFPAVTTSVLVSNDGGFLNPTPFVPTATVDWTLDSAGPERLPKVVYVRYLPSLVAGLQFTDDIILDTRPPTVSSASLSGAGSAAAVRAAKTKTWTLKLKAKDDNSGVGFAQATSNKKKPGALLAYKSKLRIKSSKKPKFTRVRDRAGNFSAWKKLR